MSIDADQTAGLLTITEVAEFLRISIPTVRRLIEQRQIPFLKVGGSIRFTRSDIDAYLQKRRVRSIDGNNKL
jgi:excisionase family DNA binding protein